MTAVVGCLQLAYSLCNGTLICCAGRLLILRYTPTWILIGGIRVIVRVLGWQRAIIRSVRFIPRWPRRALRVAPHVARALLLTITITFVHGWTFRRADTHVAPLPRAQPHGTTSAVSRASVLADSISPVAVRPRSAPAPPRQVGFALRSSSLRVPKLKARDISARVPWRSSHTILRWLEVVIDSGCTWHVHHTLEDLVNVKPCNDTVVDAQGNTVVCAWVGDLRVVMLDHRNHEYCVTLRGVRYSPHFQDTLISVDQLWFSSGIDSVFRDVRRLVFTKNLMADGSRLEVPFKRRDGMFKLAVGVCRETGSAAKLKSGIHAATSRSHIEMLPANEAAASLHRRLHVSLKHITSLHESAADAPAHLSKATHLTCSKCAEANATRLSHPSSLYRPSYPGRLVHADIVGPFRPSYVGGYRYSLILVDDHSRFKFVYHMVKKSEAPKLVRRFVASFNGRVNSTSRTMTRMVGSLHTDNAGELVSREFQELMDSESIEHTTSPPHVHQLNGVAERSIRSVAELARSYLVAGSVQVQFWPFAFDMAVDVLNRTSGPEDKIISYEMLTGSKPPVMNIMPFGCRAFAVKPREQYSKTDIDPRSWVGVNLGRSLSTPGAYRIYVPDTGRVLLTSEVYFWENFFPLVCARATRDMMRTRPARRLRRTTTAVSRLVCRLSRTTPTPPPPRTRSPRWSRRLSPPLATRLGVHSCCSRALMLARMALRPFYAPAASRLIRSTATPLTGGGAITIFSTTHTSSPCSS